jgi:hypothetical protein
MDKINEKIIALLKKNSRISWISPICLEHVVPKVSKIC